MTPQTTAFRTYPPEAFRAQAVLARRHGMFESAVRLEELASRLDSGVEYGEAKRLTVSFGRGTREAVRAEGHLSLLIAAG